MNTIANQFLDRIRLLPVLMLAIALLFGLKIDGVWDGVTEFRAGVPAAKAETPAADPVEEAVTQPSGKDAVKSSDPNDISTMSESEVALLQKLSDRREELERQSRTLETRETLLTAAEKRVEERITRLKEIEASVSALIERFDKQEEERLTKLVQVYESMKPKSAAAIFNQLDMEVLLAVANRMAESKMAEVLSKMNADAAKRLTMEMAQQRKLPGSAG
ncbi:MAG: hypothetical protein Q7N95_18140 [Alphaproteobacteria bacterium]|nr:hypothetical protein [Alphaproteobacteria bacterium]